MAVVPMQKIRLYVHRNDTSDVLHAIQKLGAVEFSAVATPVAPSDDEYETSAIHHASSRLDFAVKFLSRFEEKKKGALRSAIEGDKLPASEKDIESIAADFHFNDSIDALQELEEKLNSAQAKQKEIAAEKTLLSAWIFIDTSLAGGLETTKTRMFLFQGKEDRISSFAESIAATPILHEVIRDNAGKVAVVALKDANEEILRLSRENDLESIELPKTNGTPKEAIAHLSNTEKEIADLVELYTNEIKQFLPLLPKLKVMSDYMFWNKSKHELINAASRTTSVRTFEGWCPKDTLSQIETSVSTITKDFAIEPLTPEEGEFPPVEIKNNWLLRPFEAVTRLYGLPTHKDLDPTAFLAGFFFVFFGFCLPDVGHGIILVVLALSLLFFFRVPKDMKPLITLLGVCGVGAIGAGILFGDYFGIEAKEISPVLENLRMFNPIESPITVLGLALGFGVIQIMFGVFLKIVAKAKQGELTAGLLEQVPWLSLFSAIIASVLATKSMIPGETQIYIWWIYASLIAIVLTAGHHEKGIVKKISHGLSGLYHGVGFLSDLLSYSRIFALGLAAGALTFAVNLIATLVNDMIPYVGFILMIIILLIGQTFTIAIGVLAGFIHSARLQFVEFFGKFIAGTGRKFSPFERKERYVVVE
jgi:V/A-type H+-transporting ATPase subunit I